MLIGAVFSGAPPAARGLGPLADRARERRRALHLAVGRAERTSCRGALRLDELGLAGRADRDLRRGLRDPADLARAGGRATRLEPRHGEFQALLLSSVLGMVLLAQAQNLIILFVSLELLSVPSTSSAARRCGAPRSLESGLKYLIVGSLGSATLLYGLAFIYGGSGSTDFTGIRDGDRRRAHRRPAGPDRDRAGGHGARVQDLDRPVPPVDAGRLPGRPHPGDRVHGGRHQGGGVRVFVRFFEVALGPAVDNWQPALAALAAVSIVVGNVGALGQNSLKRLLGYSGVAQAGYMLIGLVAASRARRQRAGLLPGRLHADEPRRVRA